MFGKIIFFISVCMLIKIGDCGNSNEHVHIKLHVPEIIKRHTHIRTVYKHHEQPKSNKPKKRPHARRDPKIKHDMSAKFEAAEYRPIWIQKLPHYKQRATEEIEPINQRQHKFEKPKHSQNNPYSLIEMMAESGNDESNLNHKLYKQMQLKEKLKSQQMIPDYMVMDGSLNFDQDDDDQGDIYAAAPSSEHFKNPQLIKLTGDDIRTKVPIVPKWGYEDNSQEIVKFKKPFEWPKVSSSALAYQYTTLAPFHLQSDVEDVDEFMPSTLIQQTKHSNEDYPHLFQSHKPQPMDLQYTYTKYKNRQSLKNAMSNLNTRVN